MKTDLCWPIGGIINNNDAWLFTMLEKFSLYWIWFFPADGFTFSNSWMFQFLIAFEKKLFRISAFLAFCVKVRSSSTSMIFSSWLCIFRKKRLHSFPKMYLLSFDFASNQVLLFIEKICHNFLLSKKQFCYPNNCIQ